MKASGMEVSCQSRTGDGTRAAMDADLVPSTHQHVKARQRGRPLCLHVESGQKSAYLPHSDNASTAIDKAGRVSANPRASRRGFSRNGIHVIAAGHCPVAGSALAARLLEPPAC